jgi:hypothetical protein
VDTSLCNENLKTVGSEKFGEGLTLDPVTDKRRQRKGTVGSRGNMRGVKEGVDNY